MRISQLFSATLRQEPRESEGAGHALLLRAGALRQLATGVSSLLPPGLRSLQKIAALARKEIERLGGQEVLLPTLQPAETWERLADSAPVRAVLADERLFWLTDHRGRRLTLAPAQIVTITLLAQELVRSYRDLPRRIYQIQTTFRDESRGGGGLLRTRESLMLDLYSLEATEQNLDESFRAISQACQRIIEGGDLPCVVAETASPAGAGSLAQAYIVLAPAGEEAVLLCSGCGYAATREQATFVREQLPAEAEEPLTEIYTPGVTSIADLANFLQISPAKTLKTVCYVAANRLLMTLVRGDLDISEGKLRRVLARAGLHPGDLHLATPEELAAAGIVAGYTSPLTQSEQTLILADHSLRTGSNFVAGANRRDFHMLHVNYPRDFRVDGWEDLAQAYTGATCVQCGGQLRLEHGWEIGHSLKLGEIFSQALGVHFLNTQGEERPLLAGWYEINLQRLLAAIVAQHHDERGIIWPPQVAPYQVALVGLDLDKEEPRRLAERLYAELDAAGVEVLYDDRFESAGVKFNDADLLGLPLRLVVSRRSLQNGGVEIRARGGRLAERCPTRVLPPAEAVREISLLLKAAPP
jgi:prolyl-tRNA synthetase